MQCQPHKKWNFETPGLWQCGTKEDQTTKCNQPIGEATTTVQEGSGELPGWEVDAETWQAPVMLCGTWWQGEKEKGVNEQ